VCPHRANLAYYDDQYHLVIVYDHTTTRQRLLGARAPIFNKALDSDPSRMGPALLTGR
jgi:hypothetical protein